MKIADSFERDIKEATQGIPRTPEQLELARVREELMRLRETVARTPQHQAWAWTRLEASLRQPAEPWWALVSLKWFTGGVAVAACAGLALMMLRSEVVDTGWKTTVVSQGEKLHAVPFHSKRANADVLWVDGYDYLPASYPLR
jgi:hypothetical protein